MAGALGPSSVVADSGPPDNIMPPGLNSAGPDLAINTDLTDSAGNQLRVLGAEIQYQYSMLVNVLCHIQGYPSL